ncbi:tail fiber domain-containing protein [uncultured Psychroserpens sp.]|uniref:tail fiber domain-containing protein n=1 Tax=uncultured Psychroserpens sp. TaxID=255436 RepID=UPI0026370891|nr:tail fiber domain-containing protein [uncultured Psychroserpens sp.]
MNFSKKNHELNKSNRYTVSKTFQLFLIMLCISAIGFAQNGINYKALIKDTNGNVINSQNIDIQFSINIEGATVYRETQQITTDVNGIAIATIGLGTVSIGNFENILWRNGNTFLNVQIDFGSGYIDLGTTAFHAVPYAIHALTSEGLEPIDEGNGIGWRLTDSNPNNHGNIGLNAIDLSSSFTASNLRGATGDYAIATGFNTTASGIYSIATGRNTVASGFNSTAMGNQSSASGITSMALGHLIDVTGDYATAFGSQTTASGDYSTAMGSQTTATGNYSTAMGRNTSTSGIYATAMGRNTTASAYSTAMGDGTEATGSYSTAMGRETTATGVNSTAMGRSTIASAQNSTALGDETQALAPSSTAMGGNTIASGNFSTAMGNSTEAAGAYSTAMGYFTTGSGFSSSVNGVRTTAPSYAETVVGTYNTNYTPNASLTWNALDRLFVVGNGQSGSRSNAMVILKNGNIGIGNDTPDEKLHITGGRLKIGTETIEDGGNNALRFNASLLPDNNNVMSLGNSTLRWTGLWATDGTINTSDRREKKHIKALDYGLTEVLQMNPVSFKWKDRKDQDTKLGLIAQDLLELVPEVVKTHEWKTISDTNNTTEKVKLNRLGVYYSDLIPVLIKAIQEQQKIIDNEKSINAKQNSQLEALLSRIEDLEANQSN